MSYTIFTPSSKELPSAGLGELNPCVYPESIMISSEATVESDSCIGMPVFAACVSVAAATSPIEDTTAKLSGGAVEGAVLVAAE